MTPRYARAEVLWRTTPHGMLALAKGGSSVSLLTGSGQAVWHVLQRELDVEAIIDELDDLFPGQSAEIRDAVPAIIGDLLERHLVVRVDGGG